MGLGAFASDLGGELPIQGPVGADRAGACPSGSWPRAAPEWPTDSVSFYGDIDMESKDDFEFTEDAESAEYYGDFAGCTKEDLFHPRLIAKRCFRKFTGRCRRDKGKGTRGMGFDQWPTGFGKGVGYGKNRVSGGHYA